MMEMWRFRRNHFSFFWTTQKPTPSNAVFILEGKKYVHVGHALPASAREQALSLKFQVIGS
jgi:hypothetical protein